MSCVNDIERPVIEFSVSTQKLEAITMNRIMAIALTAASLIAIGAFDASVLGVSYADPSPQEQKNISEKICELRPTPLCAEACAGTGDQVECHKDCKEIVASACKPTTAKSTLRTITKGICEKITALVCKESSTLCPEAHQEQCLGWCREVVVGGCPE
jgi:hypothetical protein